MEIREIIEAIKPFVKHSQKCSLNVVNGACGDYCTCDIRGRRIKISETVIKLFEKEDNEKYED